MPHQRYFYPGLLDTEQVELAGDEFFHLTKAMRQKSGELLELVNGQGALATGRIAQIEKRNCVILIQNVKKEKPPNNTLILLQGLARMNRLEIIVEKGCELGVDQFWILPCERSENSKLSDKQLARLAAIAIAAMKQCGRLWLPEIKVVKNLQEWKEPLSGFFGDLSPDAPWLLDVLKDRKEKQIFAIGPESGFSEREEKLLQELGLQGVKLNESVLRTETAALAAAAILGCGRRLLNHDTFID